MLQQLIDPICWIPAALMLALMAVGLLANRKRLRQLSERESQLQRALEEKTRQLEKMQRTVRDEANGDDLTGIANHRSFQDNLRLQWRRTARSRLPLTVLMIDVDGLKYYNDRKGHQSGDECLRQIAEVLREQLLRPGDQVARYGGDEFAVLLAETDAAGGLAVAERMRDSVESLGVSWGPDLERQRITISIGVATTVPSPQEHPTSVIAAADRALSVAKRNGGNRVEM